LSLEHKTPQGAFPLGGFVDALNSAWSLTSWSQAENRYFAAPTIGLLRSWMTTSLRLLLSSRVLSRPRTFLA